MPRVSVIVPVYNSSAYLDRCIISMVQQTFSDFELILVDDCSTDTSVKVIRNFARNDSRIKLVFHRENGGPGAARNSGLALANGDYVTFVDSDDFIEPHLLEIMFRGTDCGRLDIVETGCQAVDSEDQVLWDYTPAPAIIEQLDADANNIFLIREWGVTQKLWRRSLFANGVSFPEGVYWEDIAVVPSLIVDAKSLQRINYIGYNYLQHTASITNTRSVKHVHDLFSAFDFFVQHLKRRALFERYRDVIPYLVKSRVDYFVKNMHLMSHVDPQKIESLIRLSELILADYISISHFDFQPALTANGGIGVAGKPLHSDSKGSQIGTFSS